MNKARLLIAALAVTVCGAAVAENISGPVVPIPLATTQAAPTSTAVKGHKPQGKAAKRSGRKKGRKGGTYRKGQAPRGKNSAKTG